MEKLQPIIRQMFWICFSLAMIFILVGWWSAKGDLSTQIDTRQSEVSQAFTDAGQNVSAVPNKRWSDGGAAINKVHDRNYQASARQLWQRQLDARTYPVEIKDELNKLQFNSEIDKKALRERFAQVYPSYFRAQLDIIRPYENGKGVVDISNAQITQEDYQRWFSQRPTSPEIWKAQEDIWLLRSVFDAIAAVNKGFDRIDKAPIRSLLLLELRGGDRDAPIGGGGGGGMGAFGGAASGEMPGAEFGGGYDGAGFAGGGGARSVWSQYEGTLSGDLLTEEFGPVAGAGGGMGALGGSFDGAADGGFANPMSAEPAEEVRYVDDDENLPYRTRAFALTVKILQEEIPSLLAELTNSSFPVEIVRVDASFSGSSSRITGGTGGMDYGAETMDYGSDMESGAAGGFGGGGAGGNLGFGGRRGPGGFGAPPPSRRPGRTKQKRTLSQQKAIAQGERFLAAGLNDPDLCTLRVAGLMTLYRSQAENEAEAEAEVAAEREAKDIGGVDPDDVKMPDAPLPDAVEPGADAVPDAANQPEAGATGQPDAAGQPDAGAAGTPNGQPAVPNEVPDAGSQPAEGSAPAEGGGASQPQNGADGQPADNPADTTAPTPGN